MTSLNLAQVQFAFYSTVHQLWGRALLCSIICVVFKVPVLTSAFWMALLISGLHVTINNNKNAVVLFDTLFKFVLFASLELNPLFYLWYITMSISNYIDYGILKYNAQNIYVSRTLHQQHEVFNFVYTPQVKSIGSLIAYFLNSIIEGYILQIELLHSPLYMKLLPIGYCLLQIWAMNEHYGHLQEPRILLARRDSKMHS